MNNSNVNSAKSEGSLTNIEELLKYEPLLPHRPEIQTEANLIPGCLSHVWYCNGLVDSDSKINRALLYCIINHIPFNERLIGRSRANGMSRVRKYLDGSIVSPSTTVAPASPTRCA